MRLPLTFAVITFVATWLFSHVLIAIFAAVHINVVMSYILLMMLFGGLLALGVRSSRNVIGAIAALVCGAASVVLIAMAMMFHNLVGQTWLQLYESGSVIAMLLLFAIAFWIGSIVGGMICLTEITRRFA